MRHMRNPFRLHYTQICQQMDAHQRLGRLCKHFDIKIPRINKYKSSIEIHLITYYWTWFGKELCVHLHCRDWNVSSQQQAIQYDLLISNCYVMEKYISAWCCRQLQEFACSLKLNASFSILCSPSQLTACTIWGTWPAVQRVPHFML